MGIAVLITITVFIATTAGSISGIGGGVLIKPVLDAEPSYEDIPMGLHDPAEPRWQACDVRRYAYWSVFAGSFGHTYGHNAIMQMLKPGYPTSYGDAGDVKAWYQGLNDPGFNQMQYLKRLILSALRYNFALQLLAALDDKIAHKSYILVIEGLPRGIHG